MCGIAGEFAFEREQVTADAGRMIAALRHRGPDSNGHYLSPAKNVLLVNTRLAIVDVGGGAQPLTNEDGSVRITFNGEIYGFAALARQLESRGHRLRTRCDTEVIVHLYEEYGGSVSSNTCAANSPSRYMTGDNTPSGSAGTGSASSHCTTRWSPRSLLFGSEIKAIFSNPVIKRELNPSFIYSYLHGMLPADETAFAGVRQVEPGCLLRVTAAGVEPRRYWQPRFAERPEAADSRGAVRESVEEFRRLFAEAVDLRLQGDQEPGVYLSGGVDSRAVATQAAQLSSRPMKAFTVAFDDPDFDESAGAAATVRQHGLDHHVVTIPAAGLASHFVRSLWHCEMPVVNGHGAAKLLLSGLASRQVKSVLTGEGADELLAGYDLFRHQALIESVRREPRNPALRAQMRRFLGSVDLLSGTVRTKDYAEYDRVVELFGAYPYPALRALKLGRWIRALLSRECIRSIGDLDPLEQLATRWSSRRLAADDALSATQDFLFRTQLPSYILNCLGDRMEMANSVEGRLPFLDHKLAEFAFGLPRSLKVRDGQGKVLLREALGQSHPAYRVAKKVFLSPAATLDLRNGKSPLARYLDRRVTEDCGIFSPAMLRTLKHVQPLLRKGSISRVRCEGLLTFAISVHALHELFCTNFTGSMQRFERSL